jgi:hypothetical protein
MIKQVVTTLKMTPVVESVAIPIVHQFLDDEEGLASNGVMTGGRSATHAPLPSAASRPGHGW